VALRPTLPVAKEHHMVADMHCHYPMHLLEKEIPPDTALKH